MGSLLGKLLRVTLIPRLPFLGLAFLCALLDLLVALTARLSGVGLLVMALG
jgi:hypothetical protein